MRNHLTRKINYDIIIYKEKGENMSLSNSLQENILILLVFNDEVAPMIVSNVKYEMFGNAYYRNIAFKAIDFYRQFGKTAKEHIADLLENELNDEHSKELYTTILNGLYANKDSVHKDYVLGLLEKFIKEQNLKLAIKKAVDCLQKDDVDGAEKELEISRKSNLALFDPGTYFLKDFEKSTTFLNKSQTEGIIYTGIEELDKLEFCPFQGELFTFVARAGAGKSWFLIHLSKYALLQRKKVLHISLELSEERLKSRYFQSFFGVYGNIRDLQKFNALFEQDRYGNLVGIIQKDLLDMKSMRDEDILTYFEQNRDIITNPQLILREFPTGSLTVDALKAYLDNLESYHKFIPDIILLDYLDLMKVSSTNLRIDLGQTAVELRGIASERGIAMVTVAQTNRQGEGKGVLTRKDLAEDFSKVRVSDNLLTYTQSINSEKPLGIARLYIDKARNTRDGETIYITQNYSLGQFCLTSMRYKKNYWDILKEKGFKV